MTGQVWRLLQTAGAAGAWNMAVDEAIMLSVAAGDAPPTLRFYGWQPHCLSLGYFQPATEVDEAECSRRGIGLVRRPTGGSAILHADELTYSLAAPECDPHIAGDVVTSYLHISRPLVRGLADLGLDVTLAPVAMAAEEVETGESAPSGARGNRPAPCFMRPARHEITAGGRKLVGSAQMRRAGAVLQHGAIPLTGDAAAITRLLAMAERRRQATASKLRAAATTIAEAAGRKISSEELAASLIRAFEVAWQIDLQPSPLLEREETLAARLVSERYDNQAWTRSR